MISSDIPNAAGIYLLTHAKTGDTYVGSSKSIRTRFSAHLCDLRSGLHLNPVMVALARKHGLKFSCRVLELTGTADRYSAERAWIEKLRPTLNLIAPPSRPRPVRNIPPTVGVSARVDPDLAERFEAIAAAHERTVSYFVEKAMAEYLENHERALLKGAAK